MFLVCTIINNKLLTSYTSFQYFNFADRRQALRQVDDAPLYEEVCEDAKMENVYVDMCQQGNYQVIKALSPLYAFSQ